MNKTIKKILREQDQPNFDWVNNVHVDELDPQVGYRYHWEGYGNSVGVGSSDTIIITDILNDTIRFNTAPKSGSDDILGLKWFLEDLDNGDIVFLDTGTGELNENFDWVDEVPSHDPHVGMRFQHKTFLERNWDYEIYSITFDKVLITWTDERGNTDYDFLWTRDFQRNLERGVFTIRDTIIDENFDWTNSVEPSDPLNPQPGYLYNWKGYSKRYREGFTDDIIITDVDSEKGFIGFNTVPSKGRNDRMQLKSFIEHIERGRVTFVTDIPLSENFDWANDVDADPYHIGNLYKLHNYEDQSDVRVYEIIDVDGNMVTIQITIDGEVINTTRLSKAVLDNQTEDGFLVLVSDRGDRLNETNFDWVQGVENIAFEIGDYQYNTRTYEDVPKGFASIGDDIEYRNGDTFTVEMIRTTNGEVYDINTINEWNPSHRVDQIWGSNQRVPYLSVDPSSKNWYDSNKAMKV